MCKKKALLHQNNKLQPKSSNFHAEKLNSLAFKMLMAAFRNNYFDVVPLEAQSGLKPIHHELIEFFRDALRGIPKLSTAKKVSGKTNDPNGFKTVLMKPKLYDLFGLYSYNKAFRQRIFEDNLFSHPLALFLEHYTDFQSKFKDEFLAIFQEFKEECLKNQNSFNSVEELIEIECENFDASNSPSLTEAFLGVGANDAVQTELKEIKLFDFLNSFNVDDKVKEQAHELLMMDNLKGLFDVLVHHIESPLSVPTLHKCFELYLVLLRIKYRSAKKDDLIGYDQNGEVEFDLSQDKPIFVVIPEGDNVEMPAEDKLALVEDINDCFAGQKIPDIKFENEFGSVDSDGVFNPEGSESNELAFIMNADNKQPMNMFNAPNDPMNQHLSFGQMDNVFGEFNFF